VTDRIKRDVGGQFAPGQSGNPDGARLRKPKELLTISDLHRIVLEVAAEVVGARGGKPVTRFENAARGLAKGEAASRLGTRDFMSLATSAAHHFAASERAEAQKDRKW